MATTRATLLYQEAKLAKHPGPCGPIALSVLTDESYIDVLGILENIGADHDHGLFHMDFIQRRQQVINHGSPANGVHDFGQSGLHPCAQTGGENDGGGFLL